MFVYNCDGSKKKIKITCKTLYEFVKPLNIIYKNGTFKNRKR